MPRKFFRRKGKKTLAKKEKKLAKRVTALENDRPLNFLVTTQTWTAMSGATVGDLFIWNVVPQVNILGADATGNGQRIHSNIAGKRLRGCMSVQLAPAAGVYGAAGTHFYVNGSCNTVRLIIMQADATGITVGSFLDSGLAPGGALTIAPYNHRDFGVHTGKGLHGAKKLRNGDRRIIYDKSYKLSTNGTGGCMFKWDINLRDRITAYANIAGTITPEGGIYACLVHDDISGAVPVFQYYTEFVYID